MAERNHAHLAGLGGWRGMLAVLRQPRVMAVTWWAAVPAFAAAALLVVVTPLYLLEQGPARRSAGRVLLLYFLVFMVSAPWVSRWSDLRQRRKPWVLTGSALSLRWPARPCPWSVAWQALRCAAPCCNWRRPDVGTSIGLGDRAFCTRPSQQAEALQATPEQALAAFRFIERFGGVLAPFGGAGCCTIWPGRRCQRAGCDAVGMHYVVVGKFAALPRTQAYVTPALNPK